MCGKVSSTPGPEYFAKRKKQGNAPERHCSQEEGQRERRREKERKRKEKEEERRREREKKKEKKRKKKKKKKEKRTGQPVLPARAGSRGSAPGRQVPPGWPPARPFTV